MCASGPVTSMWWKLGGEANLVTELWEVKHPDQTASSNRTNYWGVCMFFLLEEWRTTIHSHLFLSLTNTNSVCESCGLEVIDAFSANNPTQSVFYFLPHSTIQLAKLPFSKLLGWVKSKRPTIRRESLPPPPPHWCIKMYTDTGMLAMQLCYTGTIETMPAFICQVFI